MLEEKERMEIRDGYKEKLREMEEKNSELEAKNSELTTLSYYAEQ